MFPCLLCKDACKQMQEDGDESGYWGGGSDCEANHWRCWDVMVSQDKKGEPETELLLRVARHGGVVTSSPLFTWDQEKGTVQNVERRRPTLNHFLRDSTGLSRLEHVSLTCGATMRPCCQFSPAALQLYLCVLLLLLSATADGEFCSCHLFQSSLFLPLTVLPRLLLPNWANFF